MSVPRFRQSKWGKAPQANWFWKTVIEFGKKHFSHLGMIGICIFIISSDIIKVRAAIVPQDFLKMQTITELTWFEL